MPVASDPFQHTFNLEPDAWARAEFAHAELGDERRTQRLVAIASDFARRPTAPITQATGVWASAKAAYRFMDNDDIDPAEISHAHQQALLERLGRQDLVLVAQDTSYLDYGAHPATEGRLADHYRVELRRSDGKPLRKAKVALRYSKVKLKPPAGLSHLESIELWAVLAQEVRAPKGVEPVCWKLLSTTPVTNASQARGRVQWYCRRWQIEVYFKVLKSGCGIQRRQLRNVDRLRRALAIDQVEAVRILALTMVARELPESSCEPWLGAAQWQALWLHIHRKPPRKGQEPTIRQAVMWIGRLGGHMGRAKDGPPGPITLWKGYERLNDLTRMWELCHARSN